MSRNEPEIRERTAITVFQRNRLNISRIIVNFAIADRLAEAPVRGKVADGL